MPRVCWDIIMSQRWVNAWDTDPTLPHRYVRLSGWYMWIFCLARQWSWVDSDPAFWLGWPPTFRERSVREWSTGIKLRVNQRSTSTWLHGDDDGPAVRIVWILAGLLSDWGLLSVDSGPGPPDAGNAESRWLHPPPPRQYITAEKTQQQIHREPLSRDYPEESLLLHAKNHTDKAPRASSWPIWSCWP